MPDSSNSTVSSPGTGISPSVVVSRSIQSPVPLMNAGSSPTGQAFSARYSDMNFVMLRQKNEDSDREQIAHLKSMAAAHGRASQCWIHAYVVCRDTEEAARRYLDHYVRERGDWEMIRRPVCLFPDRLGRSQALELGVNTGCQP